MYPPLPTSQYRNVLFLGWGADIEKEFLNDCDYDPSKLANLLVRANGQNISKDANRLELKSSKLQILFLTQLTSRLDLAFVVSQYLNDNKPLDLHNGGNDAR